MIMTKQQFLVRTGLEGQVLEIWLEQRWLLPAETPGGLNFSEQDLARAHLILDLKRDMGVNDEGVDVILHLIDQMHGMRRVLAHLRESMVGSADGPRSEDEGTG